MLKRKWLDRVRAYLREKGLSREELYDRTHEGECRHTLTPYKSGAKMKRMKRNILEVIIFVLRHFVRLCWIRHPIPLSND